MKYCCDNFEWAMLTIGKKGIAAVPTNIAKRNCFVIQFRSTDETVEQASDNVIQQTIHFCPWCGKKLADLIEENLEEFESIVPKYKNFVLRV